MTRIGFVGAGKVGTAFGSYLKDNGLCISGYYDAVEGMADDAARRTSSAVYPTMALLLADSDMVFLTVPDDRIVTVWEHCRRLPIAGKCFFHCSGALGSEVFAGSADASVSVGSAHPVCAVNSRDSKNVFSGKFFVLEGDPTGIEMLKSLMTKTGNNYRVIEQADKARYHAAAVASSNLFCALAQMSEDWLLSCGFDTVTAHEILTPLMTGNVENIAEHGCLDALTGPVERGDTGTVVRHLNVLEGNDREIYRLLSMRLLTLAQEKHPDKDYTNLKEVLKR